MKKITLLCFLISTLFVFSQDNWTTGDVQLGGTNFTVNFTVNTFDDVVTMVMVGPANVWLTVSPGTASGNGMGLGGEEAISFNAGGNNIVESRSMTGSLIAPTTDASNAWTTVSVDTTTNPGSVIVTATRSQNSAGDYSFPDTPPTSFPILWARGGGPSYISHNSSQGGNIGSRGGAMASNNVLSNETFKIDQTEFLLSPNPSSRILNIGVQYNSGSNFAVQVFDVLGKRIYNGQLNQEKSTIDVSSWKTGVYLVRVSSDLGTLTKRFIKQ